MTCGVSGRCRALVRSIPLRQPRPPQASIGSPGPAVLEACSVAPPRPTGVATPLTPSTQPAQRPQLRGGRVGAVPGEIAPAADTVTVSSVSVSFGLLVNPTAGRGRAASLVEPVCDRLRAAGTHVRVLTGRDVREARTVTAAALADGLDGLVALGGDGLVNLAAQELVGTGTPLGIVPSGTGNDSARALGVPLDPRAAVDVVVDGRTRIVDVGRAGGRVFLSVVSSGFDSRVNERANALTWPTGPTVYQVAMIQELRVFRPISYELVLDGDRLRTAAMLVAVGNGPSYGAGMRVCPAADLTDGLLDVTVVLPMPTWKFLRIFPSVYRGEHVKSPDVMTARAATVTVSAPGLTAYADGEPLGPLPITLESVPAALTAFVPALGGIE